MERCNDLILLLIQEGGFDLDMTYITENIIAMGFPAGDLSSGLFGYFEVSIQAILQSFLKACYILYPSWKKKSNTPLQGFYRNHMEEVIRFFEMHHKVTLACY